MIRDNALLKIEEYIHHRMLREEQILAELQKLLAAAGDNDEVSDTITSLELVSKVYGNTLAKGLILSAQANLLHHLKKLEKEKSVRCLWPDRWQLIPATKQEESSSPRN